MNSQRLTRFLDLAFVLALFIVIRDVNVPYPHTLAGLWKQHSTYLRGIGFSLWLLALWVTQYRLWDGARQVSIGGVLTSAAQVACLLADAQMMYWNLWNHKVRLHQGLLGGGLLLTLAVCWGLTHILERENPDCHEAASRQRRTLAVAFGVIAAGVVLCVLGSQRSAVYAVIAAALWMFADGLLQHKAP